MEYTFIPLNRNQYLFSENIGRKGDLMINYGLKENKTFKRFCLQNSINSVGQVTTCFLFKFLVL